MWLKQHAKQPVEKGVHLKDVIAELDQVKDLF